MKYNINVIKSVWRRLRKPSRATLDAIRSKYAVHSKVFPQTDIFGERWKHLFNKTFPEWSLPQPFESQLHTSWIATGNAYPQTITKQLESSN
jgi:hypothetical protein